jgi:hypothetical protein
MIMVNNFLTMKISIYHDATVCVRGHTQIGLRLARGRSRGTNYGALAQRLDGQIDCRYAAVCRGCRGWTRVAGQRRLGQYATETPPPESRNRKRGTVHRQGGPRVAAVCFGAVGIMLVYRCILLRAASWPACCNMDLDRCSRKCAAALFLPKRWNSMRLAGLLAQ